MIFFEQPEDHFGTKELGELEGHIWTGGNI